MKRLILCLLCFLLTTTGNCELAKNQGGNLYKDSDGKFIGYSRYDVFQKYPELSGTKQVGVDEEGNPIIVEKLMPHSWACE